MCKDCGCGLKKETQIELKGNLRNRNATQDHIHNHSLGADQEHGHGHYHHHSQNQQITLDQKNIMISLMQANDDVAQANRLWLYDHNITAHNIISSPGSGKTLLLEKTLAALKNDLSMVVLVGDQCTENDAIRLQKTGVPVKQINTISTCHLDAPMIAKELDAFVHDYEPEILLIENVGNLVCPASFDLGETTKIAVLSTTEGEDKPQKYPLLFREASAVVITKMDLMPYLDWSLPKAMENIRRLNSRAPIFVLSAKTGEGMGDWFTWLTRESKAKVV
jgi:hydrogenase nickel incorporation protein HypB